MPIRTLTMGYSLKLDGDVSKRQIISVCKELSAMFGEGHEFRPLGNNGLLSWSKWPGKLEGVGSSGKELRLMLNYKTSMTAISWPEVPPNVMQLWEEDDSLGMRRGVYRTQLAAYGEASRWTREELEIVRDVFMSAGWRVGLVSSIRGLRNRGENSRVNPKDVRYFPMVKNCRDRH